MRTPPSRSSGRRARTEMAPRILVAAPADPRLAWRAARTVRVLAQDGLSAEVVRSNAPDALARTVSASHEPAWIVRAGAVPLHAPRMPAASATGRPLVAFGATHGVLSWSDLLARTGGDLGRVLASELPRVDSVYVQNASMLAESLAAGADLDAAVRALVEAGRARFVRIASLDVACPEVPHVLEVVTTLHRGGAERIVLDLAREIAALGWHATVAVTDRPSRTTYEAPQGAVFARELATDRRGRIEAIVRVAIERGVDVVHAHLVDGDELRLLAKSGIPITTTIHNARTGWPARLETLSPADLALVIACARDVEREWLEAGLPGPVRTIWNSIKNPDARRPRERQDGRIRLLTVANHRPQKRLDRLPGVVAVLRARGLDASLKIAGEPVRADAESLAVAVRVREEAERHGVSAHVELAGTCADVSALYADADVVVSTSAFEGLSLAHMEALASGTPLVATAVSGTDELARKHRHAVIVPVDADAACIADAVTRAFEKADAGAPEALAPDFTTRRMAERHKELFARLLAAPRAAVRPKRGVVLVTNNFATGGAQSSARRLLVALAGAGVPVAAIVIQEQAAHPTAGRAALESAGVPVHVAPRAGSVDPLVTARAVAQIIDERAPEAVLFWNVIPEHKVLIADLVTDVPIRDVSPGEMYFASFERYFARPRIGSPYLTMRDYGRRLAGAVVKYEAERARAEELLGVHVDVVPNGVVVPSSPPRRIARERVVVGTLARLGRDKKIEQLVRAVAHVHSKGAFDGCELHIAGAAEQGEEAYVASLHEESAGLPIVWRGEQESAAFLASIDLFAMVSEPSGCPNASLEAMAAGLAVVATDVGGAREQIVHGETGLVVPRGDVVRFADAIAELAREGERRKAMGDAAHARAVAAFDVRRMVRDYARICGIDVALPEPEAPRRSTPIGRAHAAGAGVASVGGAVGAVADFAE